MRLLSIGVKNYRVHRDLQVDLDPSRTVIGGPNESGKSTLVEAAHHALFLGSKVTGAVLEAMRSKTSSGQPEVTVLFEAGGKTYQLRKRFAGPTGSTQLTEVGGSSWSGEVAETRVAEMLGVGRASGGKGVGGRVREQWAHLWVWQKEAGDDPTGATRAIGDRLARRLREESGPGAAVMQSETDRRVAAAIAVRDEAHFTQRGDPKAGSDLAAANKRLEAAERALQGAQSRSDAVQGAADDLGRAEQQIRDADAELDGLRTQSRALDERGRSIAQLSERRTLRESELTGKNEVLIELAKRATAIATLRAGIEDLSRALKPGTEELTRLQSEAETQRQECLKSEREATAASKAARDAQKRLNLAKSFRERFEKERRLAEVDERMQDVTECRAQQRDIGRQLSGLPALDTETLVALEQISAREKEGSAALGAMAARVELLTSDVPVVIGDTTLKVGESRVVTEDAELRVGDHVRLTVRPGGGGGLEDARREVSEAQAKLQSDLEPWGVRTLDEARQLRGKRGALEAAADVVSKELEALRADSIDEEHRAAVRELEEARALVVRLQDEVEGFAVPADEAAAISQADVAQGALDWATKEEQRTSDDLGTCRETQTGMDAALSAKKTALRKDAEELAEKEQHLALYLRDYGDDKSRADEVKAATQEAGEAGTALDEVIRELAALAPDHLEADKERIGRAISAADDFRTSARELRTSSRTTLAAGGGSDDPEEAKSIALAVRDAQADLVRRIGQRAAATRVLHQFFAEEQAQLGERYAMPLAERTSEYLQCLLGPGARTLLASDGSDVTDLRLFRLTVAPEAFAFDLLSEGAREQVAAAFRLAMAEILAGDHDGCLPIVLDDAFAYSDPERVKTLQRMLDLGARRGLQIIVLTCNPADYSELGAKRIVMTAGRAEQSPLAVRAVTPDLDEVDAEIEVMAPEVSGNAAVIPLGNASPEIADGGEPQGLSTGIVTEERLNAFVRALQHSPGNQRGNQGLREELEWDQATYDAVKQDLLDAGRIIIRPGRGGSVRLVRSAG